MYFLSLMAGTAPAAASDSAAFDIAISNLIGVTQTRSAYGLVMNKRAAVGSDSSDTNGRTEPLVGAMVVHRIYMDAVGTPREAIMEWVVELLYPALLGWNQWAWLNRRINVGVDGGGLLALGMDGENLPCEGSTIGLNTSKHGCSSMDGAILESGMDNSPMYLNAFHDAANPAGVPPQFVGQRLQLYDCQMSFLFISESQALQDLGKRQSEILSGTARSRVLVHLLYSARAGAY